MTIPPPIPSAPVVPAGVPAACSPTADERSHAMLIHICLLLHTVGLIIALVLWLSRKDQSAFIHHHGRQALSFFVASLLAAVVVIALCFLCIGFFLLPVYIILHLLFPILAAVAANRGEWYRYPVVGNLIH